MAATIGKVSAKFTASTSGLMAGVNQASSAMRRLGGDSAGLRGRLSALVAINGAQLFGSIASGVRSAVSSFASMVGSTAEAVSSMDDLAARVGMTYGELSTLSYVGSQVGVSTDQIGMAMTKAQVAFQKASEGSATAIKAFERIGLSVADLQGMSADEQFQKISEAIANLPTEAERAAAAVALFGRSGAQMLPLFNMGAGAIAEARAEAERLGLALTSQQAANINTMGDSFDRVKGAIKGVIDQIVAYLAPMITSVSNQFVELVGSIGGANIGQAIGEGLLQGARFLAQIADWMISGVQSVWQFASQVGVQWNTLWEIGARVAAGFMGAFIFIKAAFGVIILGLGKVVEALFAGLQSAGKMLGFDTSGLDGYVEWWRGFNQEILAGIQENVDAAGNQFSRAIYGGAEEAGQALAGPVTATVDAAIAAARAAMTAPSVAPKPQGQQGGGESGVAQAVKEAVQGIDSRSTEGMKEYFRLLRGDAGDNVQQQQLEELRGIRQGVEEDAIEMDVFDLAPAAGV